MVNVITAHYTSTPYKNLKGFEMYFPGFGCCRQLNVYICVLTFELRVIFQVTLICFERYFKYPGRFTPVLLPKKSFCAGKNLFI